MIERVHNVETAQRVDSARIDNLEENSSFLWEDFKEIRRMVGNIRVQVAGIVAAGSIFQILITSWVVYKITKG